MLTQMTAEIHPFRSPTLTKRKRQKPSDPRRILDPAERARLAGRGDPPETWGANDEALALASNADVHVRDDRGVDGRRRSRYDVFALLFYHAKPSKLSEASYLAVRRFQGDLAILHRTAGASDAIRATGAGQRGAYAEVMEDFSLSRVQAGERVDCALARMKPWAARLIRELCEREVIDGQIPNWHAVVARHTGEDRRQERGALVIVAADNLAESYRAIDNEPRERAA